MKIFIALFTFLAIQGCTSARFISEDTLEAIVEDFWEFIVYIKEHPYFVASSELSKVAISADLPVHEFVREVTARDAKNCLPYIQEAYDVAVDSRRVITKTRELLKKLRDGAKKCKGLFQPSDKDRCYENLKQMAITAVKPIDLAYEAIRPNISRVVDEFHECMAMAGQTEDVAVPVKPEQCLPYVQEAYDTYTEVHQIHIMAALLGYMIQETFKGCKALTTPIEKKECFEKLKKDVLTVGNPIMDAYMKIKPKIIDVMDKFDKCMA